MERTRGKVVDRVGGADWTGNWASELTVEYGRGLPHWEKLPVSHESLLESGARAQRAALFPL